ncbi:MAG: hypothetical protein ACE5JI_09405, partial [Acidobacteriota bacterium]
STSASAGAALYATSGFAFVCYLASSFSVLAAVLLCLIEEPASAQGYGKAGPGLGEDNSHDST